VPLFCLTIRNTDKTGKSYDFVTVFLTLLGKQHVILQRNKRNINIKIEKMRTKIRNLFDEIGEVLCDILPYIMVVASFTMIILATIESLYIIK